MINVLVVDLIETSQQQLARVAPQSIDEVRQQSASLIGFSEVVREQSLELKRFLRNNLYRHYRVHRMTTKADRIIRDLFSGFMGDISLLPPKYQHTAQQHEAGRGEDGRARVVADYIAGMQITG